MAEPTSNPPQPTSPAKGPTGGGNAGSASPAAPAKGPVTAAGNDDGVKAPAGRSNAANAADSGSTGSKRSVKAAVKQEAQKLRGNAADKAQTLAGQGKDKATEKLEGVSRLIDDAADQVDEKLGAQYGDYARSAASAVQGFADTLRGKEVDDLVADARDFVRKSPVIAVGAAAAVGFVLARLVRAGYEATEDDSPAGTGSAGRGARTPRS